MKVLMFGWEFPPYISGGLGTACFGMTRGLAGMGMDVTFVLPKIKGKADTGRVRVLGANEVLVGASAEEDRLWRERVQFLAVDSTLKPYINEQHYRESMKEKSGKHPGKTSGGGVLEMSGDYGDNLMEEVSRFARVGVELARTEDFDVIHAHDWMTFPAGVETKRASGKPLVIHVHATEFDRCGEHVNQAVYDLERQGMEAADLIIAVSRRTRDMIVRRYGVSPEKVRVVHNGIDRETSVSKSSVRRHLNEKLVLFLGRVTMQKGPDYFLDAAARVRSKMENVRFVMVGNGDMMPRMIEKMGAMRLTDCFHFTGFLRGKDRDRIFAMSDVYVMPSVSEPFGLTPVEAMLFDVPVIVSHQSGVAEVLNHVKKVDFWDVEALSDAIIEVLRDPAGARRMVENSREDLQHIDWDRASREIAQIYGEARQGA
jgi:glycosyltransferase involved in cell wall biosynthesis